MTDPAIVAFLGAFRRVIRQIGLYPKDHPLTEEAVATALTILNDDGERREEVLISISDSAFYLDRVLLPHASLEFASLAHELESREVESITLISPVSASDLFDFGAFVTGQADDLPAGGTIRLNEHRLTGRYEGMSALRMSYSGSLHTLRTASDAMAREGAFDLAAIMGSVEDLLGTSIDESGSSLLLATVKSYDEYTFYHSINAAILSLALGRVVGLGEDELVPIGAGALLHDIGKVSVDPRTLNHPGKLGKEQWDEIAVHPQEGAQAIMAAAGPGHEIAAMVAFEHHVRHDGGGYPNATRGRPAHAFSRMVAVADVYDALTTRRRYRRAETPNHALHLLLSGAGTAHDPDFVKALIRMLGVYPPGSILRLDNGQVVVVIRGHDEDPKQMHAVVAKDETGAIVDPEPVLVEVKDVVQQLLSDQAGVEPAALLENEAVVAQLHREYLGKTGVDTASEATDVAA